MPQRVQPQNIFTRMAPIARAIGQFSNLPQAISLVWTAAPSWTAMWAGLLVIQGVFPAVTVYLTGWLVNSLVAVVGAGLSWQAVSPVLLPVLLMATVMLLTEVLQATIEIVRTAQSEFVHDYITGLVHQKAIAVDYAFYESSDFYDRLSRATSESGEQSVTLLENLGNLLRSSITLVAIAVILLTYGIGLPILLLFSTLPAFYVLLKLNRHKYRWWEQTTTDRRWLEYYETLLTHYLSAAEVRLFQLGPYFQSRYQALRRRLRKEHIQLVRKQSFGKLAAQAIALLLSGTALLWVARQVLLGTLGLGDLALFYQAFSKGQGLMRTCLSNLGQIHHNSLFLNHLFEFLQLQPKLLDPPIPQSVPPTLKQDIQFRNITFRYPGSDRPVLHNFCLTLPAGKIVAIVGDNGAGKSTLVKLLCRFYDPEAGNIQLDGIDLRKFAVSELQPLMTVLFQSPIPYCVTAAQNIALGDLSRPPIPTDIEAAAQDAGMHATIARLPQGYDTLMGKWFPGGCELSGGEWQRLALARAFFRDAPIMILDEPTSAMDSWAEVDWLHRFRNLAAGRTVLVITHRFTVAKQADVIHVMRQGAIVESGSHDELLYQGGLYAQSWQTQMQSGLDPSCHLVNG